ncbi:MAG: DUF559 domain-containing protein [Rhodospirillales bacterium]|nr:DUF559 domain-containing protein [Rhodospirillales bacterium]
MTPHTITARARAMRSALTPPEASLWVALRRLRGEGFHFRRQAPFRGYFLDFACYAHRLVVEVDGAQHEEPEQARHDTIRDAVLARQGFRTLRFAALDVLGNLDGVVTAIRLALGETMPGPSDHPVHVAPPPPGASRHPPHKGEGEGRR